MLGSIKTIRVEISVIHEPLAPDSQVVEGLWLLLLIVELERVLVSGSTQAVVALSTQLIGQLPLTFLVEILANIL